MKPVPINTITEVENYVLFTPPHAFTWSLYVNLVDVSALVRESAFMTFKRCNSLMVESIYSIDTCIGFCLKLNGGANRA